MPSDVFTAAVRVSADLKLRYLVASKLFATSASLHPILLSYLQITPPSLAFCLQFPCFSSFFETGSSHVAQAGLEPLGSSDLLASPS